MAKKRNFDFNPATKPDLQSKDDLPPEREGKATTRTAAPLYHTSFASFIYGLALVVALIVAFNVFPFWN